MSGASSFGLSKTGACIISEGTSELLYTKGGIITMKNVYGRNHVILFFVVKFWDIFRRVVLLRGKGNMDYYSRIFL